MATIENQICEAIEAIAGNLISKANFDKTIQATIVACIDEATGKYKVKYQDNTFYAYSGDVDKKYSKNNRVYILIPGNDMTRDKTILGTVGKTSKYSSTEAGTHYKRTSPNFILKQSDVYEFYSGYPYNYTEPYGRYGKEIYNYKYNNYGTMSLLSVDPVMQYMKNSEYICIGAKFKTLFSGNITQGNYGINVFILCGEGENTYTSIISLDTEHGIFGEPYNFFNPQYKDYFFPKPNDFIRIERIELFAKDFIAQEENIGVIFDYEEDLHDIEISEIQIYAANKVDYSNIYNGINIVSPKGIILLNNMTSLPIEAEVVEQGNILNPETNVFYWFKKDASVNNTAMRNKYCSLGGLGWACLNKKDTVNAWIPATNTFDFNTSLLTAYENKFKVVSYREVSTTNIVKHEVEFSLWNYNENTKITITSNKKDNTVLRAVNDLKLTCDISPKQTGATYKYYWNAEVNNMSWMTHDEIKANFDCSISNNKINNIKLKRLNESHKNIVFTCTVIKEVNNEETIVGSESINILIENQLNNPYTLELVNGTQMFQYNELGEAPTIDGTYKIKPLTIQLIDNINNEIIDLNDAITSGRMTIKWEIDKDATLIIPIGETQAIGTGNDNIINATTYEYTLNPTFKRDNLDKNKITVTVTYDDFEFVESTNFTFITQGDSGTNGTQYSARIIPDTDNNNSIPRWVTFTTTGGTSGQFNFGPNSAIEYYTMDSDGCYGDGTTFPFRVQLLRDGEIVYDGKTGQESSGNKPAIEVVWDMQTKSYNGSIKDKSNYQVVKPSGSQVLTMKYIKTLYTNNTSPVSNTLTDLNHTPANILKCSIEYTPKITQVAEDESLEDKLQSNNSLMIYATLPIVTVINKSGYDITFNTDTGFSEVVYNRDACEPRYDSSKQEFEIDFGEADFSYSNCKWYVKGYSSIQIPNSGKPKLLAANGLTIEPVDSENPYNDVNKKIIKPAYKFNGDSVTNAILIKYETTYIHIPIDMHLNRFGLRMLNEWDGTSIELNEEGGYILAPQIGAGKKDKDNKFTGIVMGEAKDERQKDMHPGLFAYNKSERTFALMADSGICAIGKPGNSQIIVDPSSNRGCIYSGAFFKDSAIDDSTGFVSSKILEGLWTRYAGENRDNSAVEDVIGTEGLLIDFTEGRIYSASGKFDLDQYGNMICLEGHFSNKYLRWYKYDSKTKKGTKNEGIRDCENYFVDLSKYDTSNSGKKKATKYFLYCRPEKSKDENYKDEKVTFSVTKDGKLFSSSGEIGGFKINKTNITSGTISKAFENSKSVITLSNETFTRKGMNVVTPYKDQDIEFVPDDWENFFDIQPINEVEEIEVDYPIVDDDEQTINDEDSQTINNDNEDEIIETGHTILRNIELKNKNVDNLLIAIGDDFGITEEGIAYSREIYSRRACFQNLVSRKLLIDENGYIGKNLCVRKNLSVEGDLEVIGDLIVKGTIYAKEIKTDKVAASTKIETAELEVGNIYLHRDLKTFSNSRIEVSTNSSDFEDYQKTIYFDNL